MSALAGLAMVGAAVALGSSDSDHRSRIRSALDSMSAELRDVGPSRTQNRPCGVQLRKLIAASRLFSSAVAHADSIDDVGLRVALETPIDKGRKKLSKKLSEFTTSGCVALKRST